jgi:peptidoglycan/xylan/chitin deacetylase (PgdA/CDA1 family)
MVPGRQQDIVSRVSRRLAEFDRAKTFAMRNARPIVSFTFDDIPDSALDNGARALSRNDVHGTFYVAGGISLRTRPSSTCARSRSRQPSAS